MVLDINMDQVVDVVLVVGLYVTQLCIMVIQKNETGVPAGQKARPAVGCLPAPLRFGPAKKPAGLSSSPPNARGSAPQQFGV